MGVWAETSRIFPYIYDPFSISSIDPIFINCLNNPRQNHFFHIFTLLDSHALKTNKKNTHYFYKLENNFSFAKLRAGGYIL